MAKSNGVLGIGFGLALFWGAFPVLFWNEGRAVQMAQALAEGAAQVQSITTTALEPATEGKLVYVQGTAQTTETLTDAQLGVRSPAIRLQRQVELYQWREKRSSKDQGPDTISYVKEWSSQLIASDNYQFGHQNPTVFGAAGFELKPAHWQAQTVTLGVLRLADDLVRQMQPHALRLDNTAASGLPPELRRLAQVFDGQLYFGANPQTPAIGDLRVRYQYVPATAEVSVVAGQVGAALVPYQTSNGRLLALLGMGLVPASSLFAEAELANTIQTWLLRVVGFFMLMGGVQLIVSPLTGWLGQIPWLGSVLNAGISLVAAAVAGILALGTIAVAWFYFRPWLALGLGLLGVLLATWLYRRGKPA